MLIPRFEAVSVVFRFGSLGGWRRSGCVRIQSLPQLLGNAIAIAKHHPQNLGRIIASRAYIACSVLVRRYEILFAIFKYIN